jgi:hypothetical protein
MFTICHLELFVMRTFVELIIIIPLLILCFQLYFFSINSIGVQKQQRCQKLGIVFMTFGIVALVFKTVPIVSFGLVLMLFGFSLISKGLDRLDKKFYVDQSVD